jgi:hypothetical protein
VIVVPIILFESCEAQRIMCNFPRIIKVDQVTEVLDSLILVNIDRLLRMAKHLNKFLETIASGGVAKANVRTRNRF